MERAEAEALVEAVGARRILAVHAERGVGQAGAAKGLDRGGQERRGDPPPAVRAHDAEVADPAVAPPGEGFVLRVDPVARDADDAIAVEREEREVEPRAMLRELLAPRDRIARRGSPVVGESLVLGDARGLGSGFVPRDDGDPRDRRRVEGRGQVAHQLVAVARRNQPVAGEERERVGLRGVGDGAHVARQSGGRRGQALRGGREEPGQQLPADPLSASVGIDAAEEEGTGLALAIVPAPNASPRDHLTVALDQAGVAGQVEERIGEPLRDLLVRRDERARLVDLDAALERVNGAEVRGRDGAQAHFFAGSAFSRSASQAVATSRAAAVASRPAR